MSTKSVVIGAVLVSMLVIVVGVSAQSGPAWEVTSASPLTLPSSVGLRIYPAPDGHQFGYERSVRLNGHIDRFMCVDDSAASSEPVCLVPPSELPRGLDVDSRSHFAPAAWSADSSQVAVVGQPLLTGSDTDLWIMDPGAGGWVVVLDDGYDGPLYETDDSDGPPPGVSIEVQPAWSPDGTLLAVERTVVGEQGGFEPSTLSLVDVASGDIRDLAFLPGYVDGVPDAGSITSLEWSPDGASLGLTVQHAGLPEHDGVWLVDADSGQLTQLLGVADIAAALADVYSEVMLENIGPLTWSPDGRYLLLWAGRVSGTPMAVWTFVVEVETASVTPLALPVHPNDTGERRTIWPIQAAWSPDSTTLVVLTNGKHPDEDLQSLDPDGRARVSLRTVDVTTGESQLLGGLPAGAAVPLYTASFGLEGGVLINGYQLALVPR